MKTKEWPGKKDPLSNKIHQDIIWDELSIGQLQKQKKPDRKHVFNKTMVTQKNITHD